MAVLDAATDSVIEYVAAPRGGSGVWNPVTDRLYYAASDQPGRSVAVFDCATNQVLRRLDAVVVGACDSIRNRVYCMDDSALLVYDGATDTLVVRVPIPTPGPFTWNPASGRVYVGSGGSDVYVIRDPTGIEEAPARTSGQRAGATVVRGVLYLQVDSRQNTGYRVDRGDCHNVDCTRGPTLLDAAGRKVMELVPGPNDVRHLASGVYFVRSEPSAVSREPSAVRKVVIQR
jgi:DNA-binding beta-propeller fold protein YncE